MTRLTAALILDMPASPELDHLVADRVMDWMADDVLKMWCSPGTRHCPMDMWRPSVLYHDACHDVLDACIRRWRVQPVLEYHAGKGWQCSMWCVFAMADTLPLAICRAALLLGLVMIGDDGWEMPDA